MSAPSFLDGIVVGILLAIIYETFGVILRRCLASRPQEEMK